VSVGGYKQLTPEETVRLAVLAADFRRAVRRDAAILAAVIRALRNPRAAAEFSEAVRNIVIEARREMQP
jgi:hypothetical protein